MDHRTCQVVGMLHGGASAALAETVGSCAGILSCNLETHFALGLDLKCNHVRPAFGGTWVTASATAIHVGRRTQVWQIEIKDEAGAMVCFSTHTVAVLEHTPESKAFTEGLLSGNAGGGR